MKGNEILYQSICTHFKNSIYIQALLTKYVTEPFKVAHFRGRVTCSSIAFDKMYVGSWEMQVEKQVLVFSQQKK